jgi:hypothetical protein
VTNIEPIRDVINAEPMTTVSRDREVDWLWHPAAVQWLLPGVFERTDSLQEETPADRCTPGPALKEGLDAGTGEKPASWPRPVGGIRLTPTRHIRDRGLQSIPVATASIALARAIASRCRWALQSVPQFANRSSRVLGDAVSRGASSSSRMS